jgi:predicted regulator of Ras-like GTPase activity (Roadblock/LC7/MglB family)
MSDYPDMSPFGRTLRELVESVPGAHGAVFLDNEGEPVDQFGRGPILEIQLTGAQWGVVLERVREALARARVGAPRSIHIGCDDVQLFIRAITSDYCVVLQTSPDAHLGQTQAELDRAVDELIRQM